MYTLTNADPMGDNQFGSACYCQGASYKEPLPK